MLAYYPPEWESLASRIVGRWCPSFSGATGLQLPDTMGRNHGVLTNMDPDSDWVVSSGKGALDFDGNNDFVRFASNPAFSIQNPSVSVWVYMRAQNGNIKVILDNDHGALQGWVIQSEDANSLRRFYFAWHDGLSFRGTGAANTVTIPLDTWSHVCYVKNGPVISGYLDARLIYSTTTANGNINYSSPLRQVFLGNQTNGSRQWNGQIDDIAIFNTALTASEVRFLYEQGRGGGMLYQPPRRRSVAAIIAALVLACETGNYSLTGQAAGLFASRVLAADQAQYLLSGNAANITASRLLSADPASYTATGNDAATICARLLDGGAAAYALTGTDAGLIANRKLTADQAVCFLAGNNAELLRSLKLNADSMSLQIDNFAASLLADRKISADGAQYILVVSDANLTGSASGVAPYYYLFMMRGPQ